jgi:hypothetical protein
MEQEQTQEFYKNEVIKMIEALDSKAILRYIYLIVRDIKKDDPQAFKIAE